MKFQSPKRFLALISAMTVVASGLIFGQSSPSYAAACGAGTRPTLGNGDSGDPWRISSPENLLWVSWASSAANTGSGPTRAEALADNYLQVADIDLADLTGADAGCDWVPIGQGSAFSGRYDGAGYTISGLRTPVSTADNQGMFGLVQQGLVSRVHLRGVVFNGDDSIGGIAGKLGGASGRITESSVTGSVSGRLYVGGLVGHLLQAASIDNSFSRASVPVSNTQNLSTGLAGGLVGYVSNDVSNDVVNSFSTGPVTPFNGSTTNLGGLIGGTPTMTVTNSFWDTETSQQTLSGGGSGKTTTEMLALTTFSNSGWAIVDGWEAYDFDSPTKKWGICSGVNDGYPFLLSSYRTNPCPVRSDGSAEGRALSPAIHLDLKANVGDQITGRPVEIAGTGLGGGSAYTLIVRSNPTTVDSGNANGMGNFSNTVRMPALPAGTHTLTLTATAPDGTSLTLFQTFTVSSSGVITAITEPLGKLGRALAATGRDSQSVMWGFGLAMALLLAGVLARVARRKMEPTQK